MFKKVKNHPGIRKFTTTKLDAHMKPIAMSVSNVAPIKDIGRFSNKGPGVSNIFSQKNY